MKMPPIPAALRRRFGIHVPQMTVVTRLTILYSAVFLLCGAALLSITYLLVEHSTDTADFFFTGRSNPGRNGAAYRHIFSVGSNAYRVVKVPPLPPRLKALVSQVQAHELHQLLVSSGIALASMVVAAVALGYLVANRSLRPLRSMTATARGISVGNLHERLAMTGPDDELKVLGDTLDELLGRLEASFTSQRQFVANASHELRSPLTRLRLLAEVAATDPDATVGSMQTAYQRVVAASEQQEQLIEALLVLAKSQGGFVGREFVDLTAVVDNTLAALSDLPHELPTAGLYMETSLAPAVVNGDPRLIERLVANLIDNAMRYNVSGGSIEVATATDGQGTFLRVSNDGEVIPSTELDRLFRPFQRLQADRLHHKSGHGLGLSIVGAIAEAHEATITVEPRPAGGLQVEVRFPITGPATENPKHSPAGASAIRLTKEPIDRRRRLLS